MIGEATPRYIGVTDGESDWAAWFAPYFALLHRQPEIKASSYINWDWSHWSQTLGFDWHDWGDARVQKNPLILERMRAEMSSPLYQHGTSAAP
ncbi:hypothetical protein [Actomonas aquatica]|uniref:GH26 domain-containing protein n=1 Tax=Actomonas aquatica TaxID=2866162 RepID=A0ABZ1C2C7_9BACT|nr:hypothetical protein [Opitutus sp. WL0086]WRQ85829.1 hypothetical protein K1X11_013535 [Opitutus sp. WL0086]